MKHRDLVQSLFLHGTIEISKEKAQIIKGLVDKVITLAKKKKIYRFGLTKEIISKLGNRTSGYTSILRLGKRLGDNTMMVRMSLIGAEELKPRKRVAHKK